MLQPSSATIIIITFIYHPTPPKKQNIPPFCLPPISPAHYLPAHPPAILPVHSNQRPKTRYRLSASCNLAVLVVLDASHLRELSPVFLRPFFHFMQFDRSRRQLPQPVWVLLVGLQDGVLPFSVEVSARAPFHLQERVVCSGSGVVCRKRRGGARW